MIPFLYCESPGLIPKSRLYGNQGHHFLIPYHNRVQFKKSCLPCMYVKQRHREDLYHMQIMKLQHGRLTWKEGNNHWNEHKLNIIHWISQNFRHNTPSWPGHGFKGLRCISSQPVASTTAKIIVVRWNSLVKNYFHSNYVQFFCSFCNTRPLQY